MIDEADKAPTEVVCVIKALLEDGEILLADGRRFVTRKSIMFRTARHPLAPASTVEGDRWQTSPVYRVADGFLCIALANPPGYPFMGNDFFHEMGDVFACHSIDNVDKESEVHLLRAYAPKVLENFVENVMFCS